MLPAGRLRHFAIQSSGLVHRTDVRATDLSRTIRAGCSGARSHCRLGRSVAKEHGATSGRSSHSRATTGVGRTSHRAASRSARTGTAPSIPARRSGANHLPRPRLSLPHAPAPTHKASLPTKLPSLLPSSLPLNLRSCAIAVGTISLGNCPTS
jgi:hypothetical protein